MRYLPQMTAALVLVLLTATSAGAGSIATETILSTDTSFPALGDGISKAVVTNDTNTLNLQPAIWPFGGDDEPQTTVQQKSTRKAFFLSFLVPGLGEAYVGSKTSVLFLGVEAFAWWMYLTNTNEGRDREDEFQDYANAHWNYVVDAGYDSPLDADTFDEPSYFEWLKYHFQEVNLPRFGDVNTLDPYDYEQINALLEETVTKTGSSINGYSVHDLPSTKTQQYYEMIGKYPQFVYGWEDVDDLDADGNPLNSTVRVGATVNYSENIRNINSPMREHYEDMRKSSNDALKAGQRGVYVMLLNRVVSAVHAARMAYKHNQKIDSELSTIDVKFVQKQIIDHKVPMLMISKKF